MVHGRTPDGRFVLSQARMKTLLLKSWVVLRLLERKFERGEIASPLRLDLKTDQIVQGEFGRFLFARVSGASSLGAVRDFVPRLCRSVVCHTRMVIHSQGGYAPQEHPRDSASVCCSRCSVEFYLLGVFESVSFAANGS
jgi:hypothetical protein